MARSDHRLGQRLHGPYAKKSMTAPTGLLHSEIACWRGSKQFQGYGAIAIIAAEGKSLRIRRISSFFAIVLDVMDLVLFHPSVNLSRKVVVTKITTDPPRATKWFLNGCIFLEN